MRTSASVIVQTHWDREWYLTNEEYTARLVRIFPLILESIETGQIDKFLFDGQTAALEDLLAHCEESIEERVIAYIKSGRINIGPWYVMPDEFLCAGEALIRNLEEGIRISKHYGETSFLGYLPDTFGHVAQMPQILKGFGINKAVVWRGVDIDDDIFEWQALNGEGVLCLFLPQGYYQQPFSKVEYIETVTQYFDGIAEKPANGTMLLTQGGDHLVPPSDLKERVSRFNSAQDKYNLKLTTLGEHIAGRCSDISEEYRTITGELRENSNAFVLPDVLSTRRYLKRLNQEIEDRLVGQIEPLLAATDLGDNYPHRYLRDTWRLLLQQHAHDSICGCSIDDVHKEMIVRFGRVGNRLDALETLASESLGLTSPYFNCPEKLSPFADDSQMTAFNPSPKARSGWQRVQIFLEGEEASNLEISDENGVRYDSIVCGRVQHRAFASPIDDFPKHTVGHLYEVFVRLEIDGWESKNLCVAKIFEGEIDFALMSSDEHQVEPRIKNEWLSIGVSSSGIQIENIRPGSAVKATMSIISESDAGDSYNFSPPEEPWITEAEIVNSHGRNFGEDGSELEVTFSMSQPEALNVERNGASDEQVTSHGVLRLLLLRGEPFVRATLQWMNKAKDHRLRMVLPLGEKISTTCSDSAFALVDRPVVYREERTAISKSEARVSVNPSYSLIQAGEFSVAHSAMQEYEILDHGEKDSLALTLIRSVGWLSRRDLITRGLGAGPDFETPEAQCIDGEEEFKFLLSLDSSTEDRLSLEQADDFRRPILFLKGAGKVTDQPLSIRADKLTLSSCRQVGTEIEIRLFNPYSEGLEYDLGGGSSRRVTIAGSETQNQTNIVEPGDIVTLRIKR